jgi:hypothetical protein
MLRDAIVAIIRPDDLGARFRRPDGTPDADKLRVHLLLPAGVASYVPKDSQELIQFENSPDDDRRRLVDLALSIY